MDFEDLLDTPEWSSYSIFLREDFDELEVGSGGLFKNFLAGVKRVLMEIVEGIVSRECSSAIKFMGERLRRFIEVDRLDERDRDGNSIKYEVNCRTGILSKDCASVCPGVLRSTRRYSDKCWGRDVLGSFRRDRGGEGIPTTLRKLIIEFGEGGD